MLVTTCKHCAARFRVTPDQLNLRQGQVRCGECGGVFNGFEALERFPGDDTGTRLLAARATPATSVEPAEPEPLAPGALPQAFAAMEQDEVPPPDVEGPPPGHEPPVETPAPRQHWAVVQDGEPPVPAEPQPDPMPELEPPVEPTVPTPRRPVEVSRPLSDFAMPVPEPTPAPPPSRAWAFAAVLLALVMGMQLAYGFRAEISARYPAARPVLESACTLARCTVPWINQDGALKLEDSELLEVPGKPGQIALVARIRSLASAPMEFPHVELTLTDATGQTAVRRVLAPADYLGRSPVAGDVLEPGRDLLVSLRLDTGRVKATGYELMLFYP
ncbi:MAG: DUF3426 domain-containing protein [Betaproteobacteria bacterium]|nr:DUF3426 domain-containing protein [Betaproteobacteria bacterium]